MKRILSEEKSVLLVSFFLVLFVFCVPISASLKSISSVLCLAAILFTPYYRKHVLAAFKTPWAQVGLIYFAYVVLAFFWSDAPFSMRLSMTDKYLKLLYLPILAVGFINPKTRRWAFNAYFAIMLITCFISFLKQQQFVGLNNMEDTGEVFHNHIVTGFLVALAVYFAGVLSFDKHLNKWLRAYYLVMVVVGSYQIFFLNTGRTGYAVYGLLICLLLVQKLPLKKAMLGLTLFCGAVGLIYLASPLMQVRTAALISDIKFLQKHEENTSLGFRVQFHNYAHSLFNKHPIIGVGTGAFKYNYAKDQPVPAWDRKLNDPHSQYWLTLAEHGIIGFILLVIFIATLFITTFRLSKETRPIPLGILVAFCFGGFTDSILCFSSVGTLLIIFCALGFSELLVKKNARVAANDCVLSPVNGTELAV